MERLEEVLAAVGGKERLVIDLSCRRRGDKWIVAMNRWQTMTDMEVNKGLTQHHHRSLGLYSYYYR